MCKNHVYIIVCLEPIERSAIWTPDRENVDKKAVVVDDDDGEEGIIAM